MNGPWGALCISVYSLKRGRSQLTEEGIVRPTALMADTRLMGVSIGRTKTTYATFACLGGGCYGSGIDFLIVPPLPLQGWVVRQRCRSRKPRGEAPSGKARLRCLSGGRGNREDLLYYIHW